MHINFTDWGLLSLLTLLGAASCGDDGKVEEAASAATAVTYQGEVRALVETRCISCHREGGIAPFSLETWPQVRSHASAIVSAVVSGAMPPFHFDDTCRSLVSDVPRLSAQEREVFVRWRDSGFAGGAPSSYVAPKLAETKQLGPPDLVLKASEGYAPNAMLSDDYRCLPLGEPLAHDTFVTAGNVRPDHTDLVHHVILYAVPASASAELKALDDAGAGPGFPCFGDAGVDSAQMVTGWVPGGDARDFGPGTALRVTAGSTLVMQVHYNLSASHGRDGSASDPLPTDHTALELWTLPFGQEPERLLNFVAVADLGLMIPPGDAASAQKSARRLLLDATIVGVAPHMHLLGRSLRAELERPDGTRECLSAVPNWDFHWQRSYMFAQGSEVRVGPEDIVHLTCTFDNSAGHQPEGQGAPREVRWGEGTRDEMCLDYLLVTVPYRKAEESGTCSGYRPCAATCAPNDSACHFACLGGLGDSCLDCGLDAFTGTCAEAHCMPQLSTFGQCFEGCPTQDTDDYGSCFIERCRAQADELVACMRPVLEGARCDLSACGGLTPGRTP